jgi:flagellar biosynthesis/type III secretory pathway protein FliH
MNKDLTQHVNANNYESEYSLRVRKIITQKKIKLIKKSLFQGKKDAELLSKDFFSKWVTLHRQITQKKINIILSRAEAIIDNHLRAERKVIIAMALKLLKNIAEHTDVELTTHPIDATTLRASINEITSACLSARKITITSDDSFSRGSILVKANKSIIDAHRKTQIEKAKETLKKFLRD